MKKSYLALVCGMIFLLTSCNTNPIQQKWKVADVKIPDVKGLIKLAPMIMGSSKLSQLVPAGLLKEGNTTKVIVEILKQATFEFKSGNKCAVNLFGKDATGTYRLSEDKKTLTINSDDLKLGNKMDIKEMSASKLSFDMHLGGQVITFMLQPE
ncbi:MAG TPA: hypothetical protein DCS93_21540 [Microscillaceae bacterium]|nr:hypothetical protein [Microscillaceae bacterium]